MAEAAVLDREIEPAPPFPDATETPGPRKNKPGPGRPEGSTKEATEKERVLDSRSFDELIKSLTDADWEKHIVYVWRTDPWYDNTNGGIDKKYISRSVQPVTEQTLLEEHGSGSYKVQLNRYTSPKNDKPIAFARYDVLNMKYPPALPPGDWLNHPKNKKWVPWKPLIEQRWADEVARQTKTSSAVASSDAAAVGELSKLVMKLIEQKTGQPAAASEADKVTSTLVTWALTQTADTRKAERDENSPSKLAELIKAVKELIAPPVEAKGIDPVLSQVLTGLREDLKSARDDAAKERDRSSKLLERLLDTKKEDSNPLGQLDTILTVFDKVSGVASRGGPRDWKEVVADAVGEVAPKLVELGQAYVTQKAITDRTRPVAPRPQAPTPGASAAASPPPAPTTQPTASQPATAAQPATASASTAAAPDPLTVEMDINERTQLVHISILMSQALNLALKGDEFAEKICDRFGGLAYDDFVAAFDRALLLDKLKAVPEAWQLLTEHEARLPEFIAAFYHFADDPDDEPAKPEPAPAPAAKKPAAPKAKKPGVGKGKQK
jgi:hypothetical protein